MYFVNYFHKKNLPSALVSSYMICFELCFLLARPSPYTCTIYFRYTEFLPYMCAEKRELIFLSARTAAIFFLSSCFILRSPGHIRASYKTPSRSIRVLGGNGNARVAKTR